MDWVGEILGDAKVHSVHERAKRCSRSGVGPFELGEHVLSLGLGVQLAADGDVELDRRRTERGLVADQLGETSLPGAPEDLHLEETVLGHRVAGRERSLEIVVREDVRDSVRIAQDLDRLRSQRRRGDRRRGQREKDDENDAPGAHDDANSRSELGFLPGA